MEWAVVGRLMGLFLKMGRVHGGEIERLNDYLVLTVLA
jgi:hypothetical protein